MKSLYKLASFLTRAESHGLQWFQPFSWGSFLIYEKSDLRNVAGNFYTAIKVYEKKLFWITEAGVHYLWHVIYLVSPREQFVQSNTVDEEALIFTSQIL